MTHTLSSYEPVHIVLPASRVPAEVINDEVDQSLDPFCTYQEIDSRPLEYGDFVSLTMSDATLGGTEATTFNRKNSVYHIGVGEMPHGFDEAIIGMEPGQSKHVSVETHMTGSDPVALDMDIVVEAVLERIVPTLDDAFVEEHFPPAKTVQEWRKNLSSQVSKRGIEKDNQTLMNDALNELASRVQGEILKEEYEEGQDLAAARMTAAIDALAEHLEITVDDFQVTLSLPGNDVEEKMNNRKILEEEGVGDKLEQFAIREQALDWLLSTAIVEFR